MSGSTILVTGGAGFIGSHVCKLLADAGYLPVTLDNLSTGHAEAVRFGPLEIADTRDSRSVEAVMARWSPTAIIHMADVSNVAESVADPAKYHDNNVVGSLSLLRAAASRGCRRIIYSSSASVYAPPSGTLPLPEDAPLGPENPYGQTKQAVESLLADYAGQEDFRAIAFRFFNAAGADPDGALGEAHEPESHLIPIVLQVALGIRARLGIHGADFPTPDGTAIRDYVHVEDIARAHLAGLGLLAGQAGVRIYNLGNGHGHSVREILAAARSVTGRAIPADVTGRRPGDPPALVADAALAQVELGWVPRFPKVEDQIRHAWNWLRRRNSVSDPFDGQRLTDKPAPADSPVRRKVM